MAYFPKTKIEFANSPAVDAFARLRVSEPHTIFDSKQISDDAPLLWTTKLVNSATASYLQRRASTTLTASSVVGSKAIRQSRERHLYQPGKSLSWMSTCVFGDGVDGIRKRVGYFNDQNGIFFEQDGKNFYATLRSDVLIPGPTDQRISQSAWNLDRLDGTGPSGVRLDFSKTQLLTSDMQWLGVGRVRWGFGISGSFVYCHEIVGANASGSVYMSNPNLPMRYEIENVSAATSGTLEQICSSVIIEGGYETKGLIRSIDRGITPVTNVTNDGLVPIISIRMKPYSSGVNIFPTGAEILCTSASDFKWAILFNPSTTNDKASWQNVVSSSVQYDVTRDSTNALTGGIALVTGYGSTTKQNVPISFTDINGLLALGETVDNVPDQFVLAVQSTTTNAESFLGCLKWKEFK